MADGGITPAAVRSILEIAAPSREQSDFFEAFLSLVYEEVDGAAPGRSDVLLLLTTDLARLELQITSETSQMTRLASHFLHACGVPSRSGAERFKRVAEELKAEQATLWCRLKYIGSSAPVADVGFSIEREVGTRFCDVLVPGTDDFDALQKHASEESCQCSLYGSSIMPDCGVLAPTILEFNMAQVKSGKLLVSALGFFMSLGFAKPEDAVIRQLSSCKPDKCTVRAFLTIDGLTQLSLRLFGSSKLPVKDTAKALNCNSSERLRQVYTLLGDNPDIMEYAMDSQGSSLAIGYIARPQQT